MSVSYPYADWAGIDCSGFTVALPRSGSVDPGTDAIGGPPVTFESVGDRSGDGLPELLGGNEVWLSPVTFGPDGLVADKLTIDEDVVSFWPASFDLDGDGLLDWNVVVRGAPDSGVTWLLTTVSGDGADVLAAGIELNQPADFVTYAEQGVARALVRDGSGEWRSAELGPLAGP